ncbi:phage GP46 family protein [Cupriavidus basilensis]|nr:phage GP46 family protein [Cupriavidus basilensis]
MGLDPLTGDYSGQVIDDLGNAVYLRLQTPLGSWWADPTLGSRLHELQREKDVPRIQILAKQYAEEALRPILDDGRATSITVETEQPHDGRCLLLITVVDAQGRKRAFNHPVKVA